MPAQNLPGLILDRAHPLARGLVGWWPMNEAAGERTNDIAGANPGLITNVAQSSVSGWTGGPGGSAVRFDGTDDYINIPHATPLAIVGDMSISLWMYITDATAYKMAIGKDASNVAKPFDYYVRPTAADGKAQLHRGNGTASASVSCTTAPPAGRWNHLAATMLGTSVTHYLNGATNGTGTLSTTIGDGGNPVRIGARADGLTGGCVMFHVRLYSRALSAVEVAQLYADPLAGALVPSRLTRLYTVPVASPPAAATGPLSSDRLYNRSLARIFRRGETG